MLFQLEEFGERTFPEQGTIRLRHTAGDVQLVAKIPVNSRKGDMLADGVTLLAVGEGVEGRASIAVLVDGHQASRYQYVVEAIGPSGKTVRRDGLRRDARPDSGQEYTFEYREPLALVAEFRLARRTIETTDFENVWLTPRISK